ncbi:hypothetical protein LguiA_009666 [Lonicera macranthoides]
MAPPEEGRPLPKFGEWDVNDPASAEGFTQRFNKAREERRTNLVSPPRIINGKNDYKKIDSYHHRSKSKV